MCVKVIANQKWGVLRHGVLRSELFTVTRQVAPLNCTPGAKSVIADCLVSYTIAAADARFVCDSEVSSLFYFVARGVRNIAIIVSV